MKIHLMIAGISGIITINAVKHDTTLLLRAHSKIT